MISFLLPFPLLLLTKRTRVHLKNVECLYCIWTHNMVTIWLFSRHVVFWLVLFKFKPLGLSTQLGPRGHWQNRQLDIANNSGRNKYHWWKWLSSLTKVYTPNNHCNKKCGRVQETHCYMHWEGSFEPTNPLQGAYKGVRQGKAFYTMKFLMLWSQW